MRYSMMLYPASARMWFNSSMDMLIEVEIGGRASESEVEPPLRRLRSSEAA